MMKNSQVAPFVRLRKRSSHPDSTSNGLEKYSVAVSSLFPLLSPVSSLVGHTHGAALSTINYRLDFGLWTRGPHESNPVEPNRTPKIYFLELNLRSNR